MSKSKRLQRNHINKAASENVKTTAEARKVAIKTDKNTSDSFKKVFWGAVIFVILAQVIYTFSSMNQIRYEELAESVRNPFWLEHQTLYDGVSSNIGWYGSLLFIYKTFGFSINTAKFFRLFLDILAILSIALLLKKYLTFKQAIIPLIAICLSPTLLYITTMQHSHGIDLLYAPICLYLLISLNNSKGINLLFKTFLLWTIAMIAWMSYPTFVFYLIPITIIFLWQLKQLQNINSGGTIFSTVFLAGVSFLLPLIIALSYLKDINLAIYDNVTKSGIFRGAGTFEFEFSLFFTNIIGTFRDLFDKGQSYHFETAFGDFSNYYPLVACILVLIISFSLFANSKLRIFLIAAYILIFTNLFFSSFTLDPSYQPGIRRATGVLFGFYALFALSWGYVVKYPYKNSTYQLIVIICLSLLAIHQLIVYPQNLISLQNPSIYAETQWFKLAKTPDESLKIMVDAAKKDELKLGCKDPSNEGFTYCRYSESYAAVAGYCLWNNVNCNFISGYDIQSGQQIPLSVDLWETYQIQH